MRKAKQGEKETMNPRSRLAYALWEVRRILGKDRLSVKKENARRELAKDLWKVRHILQTEGIYNSGVNSGLVKDISSFIKNNPEVYGKK